MKRNLFGDEEATSEFEFADGQRFQIGLGAHVVTRRPAVDYVERLGTSEHSNVSLLPANIW